MGIEKIKTNLFITIWVGCLIPIVGVFFLLYYWAEHRWVIIPLHASLEAGGGTIALIIANVILILQRRGKICSSHLWSACALISMGILDIFHSVAAPGNYFIWLHSNATLLGGLFFFIACISQGIKVHCPKNFPLLITCYAIVFSLLSLFAEKSLPRMIFMGHFTFWAKCFNKTGGFLYLVAAFYFAATYAKKKLLDDFVFCNHCLLFAMASILFETSKLWDIAWWWWHLLRLLAYIVMIYYVFVQYSEVNDKLLEEVTERQKIEEKLKKKNEFLQRIMDSVTNGIFVLNTRGIFTTTNAKSIELTGFDEQELLGKPFSLIFPKESIFENSFSKTIAGDVISHIQTDLFNNKQQKQTVNLSLAPLHKEQEITGVVGLVEDITQRLATEEKARILEKQLLQAQRLESIGTLAGGIAHDFNNILTTILGYTELLIEESSDQNEQKEFLGDIYFAGNRAKELVEQLLTFARPQMPKRLSINLIALIKESLKMMRSTLPTTIEIQQEIMHEENFILADPSQMHQVIINLCANAFHAMEDDGGILKVGAEIIDGKDISFSEQQGQWLKIVFCDTGKGMNSDVREKIFDPFFTTKKMGKGTGLGMSVVHGIVKSHKGLIHVESTLGKGSQITVCFPLIESSIKQEVFPKKEIKMDSKNQNKKLMVIDDESQLLLFFAKVLKKHGYEVYTFEEPQKALAEFKINPHKYDLILTDQTMPQMTGSQLSEKIFTINKEIPIILMTGYSSVITKEKALLLGIREYMAKPVTIQTLLKTVQKALSC